MPPIVKVDQLADYVEGEVVLQEHRVILDLADRDRLRRMLRTWVRERTGPELDYAVLQLIRVGDPELLHDGAFDAHTLVDDFVERRRAEIEAERARNVLRYRGDGCI